MHASLLACRRMLPPRHRRAALRALCVLAVHVMDDRALPVCSRFNCDVSACLQQPQQRGGDRQECGDVCPCTFASRVWEETTQELT